MPYFRFKTRAREIPDLSKILGRYASIQKEQDALVKKVRTAGTATEQDRFNWDVLKDSEAKVDASISKHDSRYEQAAGAVAQALSSASDHIDQAIQQRQGQPNLLTVLFGTFAHWRVARQAKRFQRLHPDILIPGTIPEPKRVDRMARLHDGMLQEGLTS
jgi:hypothetical protein